MKSLLIPAIVFFLLYQCFVGFWAWSGSQLPERVATHFDGRGNPNGWMSRSANQTFMLIFGLAFPGFIVAISYLTRFMPRSLVNIPHKEYWLAPQKRRETSNYLVRQSLWFACLAVCLEIGIQWSILQANKQDPPHLPMSVLLAVLIPFLAGTVVWVAVLLRHFRRPG